MSRNATPKLVTAHGKTMTLREWSEELGVDVRILRQRIANANGRSMDELMVSNNLKEPMTVTAYGKTQTLRQWSEELGVRVETLEQRVRHGWDPEEAMTSGLRRGGTRAGVDYGPRFSRELYKGANTEPLCTDEIAQDIIASFAPMTHAEVGFVLGCTRENARQIEEKALRKLGLSPDSPRLRELLHARLEEAAEREQTWPEWSMGASA
jgi:hypothetical protein